MPKSNKKIHSISQISMHYLERSFQDDPILIKKFIKTFITQTSTTIRKIRKYLEKKEWEKLAAEAHKIKPSFGYIGCLEMEKTMEILERKAYEKINTNYLSNLIDQIDRKSKAIFSQLLEYKKTLSKTNK